ncbi:hypothetical protein [Lentzea sokolovensis]|uniref:hypothetical protein n=1 Tax=Lentzea sokolovensis TaxID=3095429 RepID=UPI0029F4B292|nr:hypothetical protein [Lentzea sp. BCCO 10_0061]
MTTPNQPDGRPQPSSGDGDPDPHVSVAKVRIRVVVPQTQLHDILAALLDRKKDEDGS